jgi:hypothetical protein
MTFLFDIKPKAVMRELNLIPKSMLAGLGLGFSSSFIWDVFLGFALSQVFWLMLRFCLVDLILIDFLNLNPKLVKWTLALASPLVIPCCASFLLQQSLAAFVLSSLTGFIGGKILHYGAALLSKILMDAESLWLQLGGYGMKGISLALA